jgi:hypothetical protein
MGKNGYHLPQSQLQFSGSIDLHQMMMYMALGKNDQKIYVIQAKEW